MNLESILSERNFNFYAICTLFEVNIDIVGSEYSLCTFMCVPNSFFHGFLVEGKSQQHLPLCITLCNLYLERNELSIVSMSLLRKQNGCQGKFRNLDSHSLKGTYILCF